MSEILVTGGAGYIGSATVDALCEKGRKVVGWAPQYTDIHEIIRMAWEWHMRKPSGYGGGSR